VRGHAFEAALVAARMVVEREYFEDARHSAPFYGGHQIARSMRRIADFLRRQGLE
jgi:hypothetical protein